MSQTPSTPTDAPEGDPVAGDTLLNSLRTLSGDLSTVGEQIGPDEVPGLLKALIYNVETGSVEPPAPKLPDPNTPVNPATADPRDVRIQELEAQVRDDQAEEQTDEAKIAALEAELAKARTPAPLFTPEEPTAPSPVEPTPVPTPEDPAPTPPAGS